MKEDEIADQLMSDLITKSNELMKEVKLPKKEWLAFYRLQTMFHYYPASQPKTVCKAEAESIRELKRHHDYSMRELAFIFQRSPATILKVLKEANISTNQ